MLTGSKPSRASSVVGLPGLIPTHDLFSSFLFLLRPLTALAHLSSSAGSLAAPSRSGVAPVRLCVCGLGVRADLDARRVLKEMPQRPSSPQCDVTGERAITRRNDKAAVTSYSGGSLALVPRRAKAPTLGRARHARARGKVKGSAIGRHPHGARRQDRGDATARPAAASPYVVR